MPPPKKLKSLAFLRWLLLLPIPLVWCALQHYGALTFLENRSIDWRFQFRGERAAPVKIVYVDIDSLSLNEIGGFPWSRKYFTRVCKAVLEEGKAKAVGIDIVFSDLGVSESVDETKLVEGNVDFGRYLARNPPVALAASYTGFRFIDVDKKQKYRALPILATDYRPLARMEPPEIPAFQSQVGVEAYYNPPIIGLIDTLANGTRVVPAWAPNNANHIYYHLAFELARLYWGLPQGAIQVKGDQIEFVRPDNSVLAVVPLRLGQLLDINWFAGWKSSTDPVHWEFSKLFQIANALAVGGESSQKAARDFFAIGDFKDAVVLIGPVDGFFQDLAVTPFDSRPAPKVGVHGNLLKTLISGDYLKRTPEWRGLEWVDFLLIFGLSIIVTALAVTTSSRSWLAALFKGLAVIAVVLYFVIAFEVFRSSHLILPVTAPLAAAFTTSFAGLVWQVLDEQKAKGRIKGMFGTYISPQLVEQMVESGEDPKLGGHVDEITAYFSDIQSFSSFSEVLTPEKLVELMNEYLTACTDIVQAQGGTLDKYIGDAVVAMFGAPIPLPDHAYRACVATQLVHVKLGQLREKWTAEGDKWPEIVKRMQSRIGINSGEATIGNMGSATRFNYTMMGDNVNLAARMESGAKSWGAYTMCTQATKDGCEKFGDRVVFRPLSRLVVKGRNTPVPVYEIVGLRENVTEQTHECIAIFKQALDRYYSRDWPGALALFEKSKELEFNIPGKTPGVVTNPSLVYIEHRIPEAIEEPPPENWDGRYIMKEK